MLYGDGQFAASRRGEDGRVPTKSMKRAAKTAFRGAGSIGAPDEQVGLAVPTRRDGVQKPNDKKLDYSSYLHVIQL